MDAVLDNLPAIIAALGTFLAALGAFIVALRNSAKVTEARVDAAEAKKQIINVGTEVYELGKRVDGRLSELLAVSVTKAHAEGKLEGEGGRVLTDAAMETAANTAAIAENTAPLKEGAK